MADNQIPGCVESIKCVGVPQCSLRGHAPCDMTGAKTIGYGTLTGRTNARGPHFSKFVDEAASISRKDYDTIMGRVEVSGSMAVTFVNRALFHNMAAGRDPCDEMLTARQVVELVTHKFANGSWQGLDPYGRAAAIWGISRDEAKRRIYLHCYGC